VNIDYFKKRLSKYLKIKLDLVVNENRCTMLNLLERTQSFARLSMHKMFLDAPEDVISAIAHYVRGTRKEKTQQNLILRGFIQQNLSRFDCSHLLDRKKLVHLGNVYDIKKIYDRINKEYFDDKMELKITWYGTPRKSRSRAIFGQYHDSLRLVKIHRILDSPFFPEVFVSFVVYHEMLHNLIPGHIDKKGRYCSHGEDFKKQERLFKQYDEATEWERKNRKHFFR